MNHTDYHLLPSLFSEVQKHKKENGLPLRRDHTLSPGQAVLRSLTQSIWSCMLTSQTNLCKLLNTITILLLKKQVHSPKVVSLPESLTQGGQAGRSGPAGSHIPQRLFLGRAQTAGLCQCT